MWNVCYLNTLANMSVVIAFSNVKLIWNNNFGKKISNKIKILAGFQKNKTVWKVIVQSTGCFGWFFEELLKSFWTILNQLEFEQLFFNQLIPFFQSDFVWKFLFENWSLILMQLNTIHSYAIAQGNFLLFFPTNHAIPLSLF